MAKMSSSDSYSYSKLNIAWDTDASLIFVASQETPPKSRVKNAGVYIKQKLLAIIAFLDGPKEL
jgi:hypothetical protein